MTFTDSHRVDSRVTQITGTAMPVNSFVVACGPGVVVVDAQLCVGDAQAVRSAVDATGKPLIAVVLTHPHPDHYAGAAVLTRGLEVPFVATRAVADVVAADDAEKNAIVGPMMGDQWPTTRRFPDQVVADDATVTFGEATFTVTSWGAAESHADTTWELAGDPEHPGTVVFAGDLVYDDEHAYLADGHGAAWLDVLDRFATSLKPEAALFVGHGRGGGVDLIDRQRTYVRTFLDAVGSALDLEPEERERRVLDTMGPLVGNDGLLFLTRLSIEPAVAAMRDHGDGPPA